MRDSRIPGRYLLLTARLNSALAAGDTAAFEAALDDTLREREESLLSEVQRLSDSLLAALDRFRTDSRIVALANKEIPDARLRLDHVLQMTEEAAHKTLDLIETSVPLADATTRKTMEFSEHLDDRSHNEIRLFLDETRRNMGDIRGNLQEVMLTQGFQDLTGQILRSVRTLIGETEVALGELAALAGGNEEAVAVRKGGLEGPAVPGVTADAVTGQGDVDDLIAGLGI
jgi:chemotaxis protein CheZ